ncbi:putative glycine cleavage system t protein [Phaeomoniella chlamydospora]|uniref:Aminomethyltransferase n=1 Tax=Phaeomoniella chlamydospora TaxID=158046 RepID=A0A0G2GKE8_PHACM|nr:putative glycine cleavage system t protein [Phaeomoniella chlamydospora]
MRKVIIGVQNTLHGPGAEAFLMQITPTSVNELSNYTSTLSVLLDPETGGIVDDTVITRLGSDSFYFVTNAGCRDGDAKFLKAELKKFSERDDRGLNWETLDDYGLIALQGPKAAEVLQRFTDSDLGTLTFGQCRSISLTLPNGTQTPELLVSRTGYTGEDGFEISIPVDNTPETADLPTKVTKALLQDTDTVRLAGLAARDSLRLEAGMCLYGHDISLLTTPPEASLTWVVSKARRSESSPSFNGASRILSQISSPKTMGRRRIGLDIEKGPPAREGAEIIDSETEKAVGVVTSGLPSPTLGGKNIAMALVDNGYHKKGTKLKVKIRKNVKDAEVVKLPFVENKFYRG